MSALDRSKPRLVAMTLALAVAAAGFIGLAAPASAAPEDPTDLSSYAPSGTVNVASTAAVTTNTSQNLAPRLVDGDLGASPFNLWVAADAGVDAGGQVDLGLSRQVVVHRVVVFPRSDAGWYGVYFPTDYTVSLLDASGAVLWQKEVTHADAFSVISAPDVIDVDTPMKAAQVRIDVIKRSAEDGGLFQLAEVAVFADPPAPDSSYQPTGTENLALGARVTASSSNEDADASWGTSFVNDGVTNPAGGGWSTDPSTKNQDPNKEAMLSLRLQCSSVVNRVVVYPARANFPKDFTVDISSDGSTWNAIGQSLGNPGNQTDPQVFDLPAGTTAQYVRLDVQTRNGPSGDDGYLVQVAEVSIFGTSPTCVSLVKPALLLKPGATDDSWFESPEPKAPSYTVSSSAPSIATVDKSGKITAVKAGKATVTLSSGANKLTVPVQVADTIKRVGDTFDISVFWPPTAGNINDEQYKNLADAGIDVVDNVEAQTATPDQNLTMASLAYQNGMQVLVQDRSVASQLTTMTAAEAAAWAKRYTNVPGVGGYFLVDEPSDATKYAQAFNAIRKAAPDYYAHLNFLPYTAFGSPANAGTAMQAWLDATGPHSNTAPDYLMYDEYPFQAAQTDYQGMFTSLDTVRKVGLENHVKTATYLQAIGIPGDLDRPTAAQMRYEANMAMAYGYKQLEYFTWWTPSGRSQQFTDGIMTADGQKTDLYAPVTKLNSEIHALGPTLMKLDAKEVYLSGDAYGQQTVPADYFVQPESTGDLVISHMVDRKDGADYLYVVNNSFTAGQDVKLQIGDDVTAVRAVSRTDGSLGAPVVLADSELTGHLDASEGVLYKLVRATDENGGGPSDGGNAGGPGSSTGATTGGGHGHAAAAVQDAAGGLADTGSSVPWGILALPVLLIGAGSALMYRRRARARQPR